MCNFTFENMATAKINTILHVIFTYFTWLRHKTTLKSYEIYHMELIEWF